MNTNSKTLYHGSTASDVEWLRPNTNKAVEGKKVIFATSDRRFALTMIHGTDKTIAVGYEIDTKTGEQVLYIKELKEGALKTLEQPGYIYEVSSKGFYKTSQQMLNEWVCDTPVKVIKHIYVENVLATLKKTTVCIRHMAV